MTNAENNHYRYYKLLRDRLHNMSTKDRIEIPLHEIEITTDYQPVNIRQLSKKIRTSPLLNGINYISEHQDIFKYPFRDNDNECEKIDPIMEIEFFSDDIPDSDFLSEIADDMVKSNFIMFRKMEKTNSMVAKRLGYDKKKEIARNNIIDHEWNYQINGIQIEKVPMNNKYILTMSNNPKNYDHQAFETKANIRSLEIYSDNYTYTAKKEGGEYAVKVKIIGELDPVTNNEIIGITNALRDKRPMNYLSL